MKNRKYSIILAALAILPLSACIGLPVVGDGRVISSERGVGSFSSVEAVGSADVRIKQGKETKVVVTTDANLQDLFEVRVSKGELWLGFKPGVMAIRPTRLEVDVTLPELTGLVLSGSGTVTLEDAFGGSDVSLTLSGSGDVTARQGLSYTNLSARLSGSGAFKAASLYATSCDMTLTGSGDIRIGEGAIGSLAARISGSGDIEAEAVSVRQASIRITGSGDATLRIDERLEAVLSGSGSVRYAGKPLIDSRSTGSGRVSPLTR